MYVKTPKTERIIMCKLTGMQKIKSGADTGK